MDTDISKEILLKINLEEKTVNNIIKNTKITNDLIAVINEANAINGCDKSTGNLLYAVATKVPESALNHRGVLAKYVFDGKIKTNYQLDCAVGYLKTIHIGDPIDISIFEEKAGVGVEITSEEVEKTVSGVIEQLKTELVEQRYQFNIAQILYQLKDGRLKWADGKALKECVDKHILDVLGPKNDQDIQIAQDMKSNKKKGNKPVVESKVEENLIDTVFVARDLAAEKNSAKLLAAHQKVTGGLIYTRFPPEPNGYIHIGHAKSMYLNFCAAFEFAKKKGACIFRYDDTNPTAESTEYINSIWEDVQWMGWKPLKVTYASDYFDQLYDYAIILIKQGNAYVCHQNKEQMKQSRELARELNTPGGRRNLCPESPWRNRTVDENLKLFNDMRMGLYEEGAATLRLKMDMRSPNPCMWDPVAYRIKYIPHPHVGDKWCIYPSYDFSHCVIDSIEDIDYSLCSLEFETRRQTYYWVVQQLDIWRAHVWEFGRLNLTNTVMSKRKLKYLVMNHIVRGWDDPRMPTVKAYRRLGFTPECINNFCREVSITRSTTTNTDHYLLDHHCRLHLDEIAPRSFAVLDPLKLIITNYPADKIETIDIPNHPRHPEMGSHKVYLQKTVYIDREDFKVEDEKKFLGLAPGKVAALKYAFDIKCTRFEADEKGDILVLYAEKVDSPETVETSTKELNKKKGNIHWVCGSTLNALPATAEGRLYEHLFLDENPGLLSDEEWLSHMNPNSEKVIPEMMIDDAVAKAKLGDRYQFERIGYFIVDVDTTPTHLVFNRTVPLKAQK